MYSTHLLPCMSVFCLAAVTEKRHISSRCVCFHTHFSAMSSPGQRISPSLSLSAGKCWQTTEPWCRTVTGSAVCSVLGRTERGNKGASGVVVSHHGCSARSLKKKRPRFCPSQPAHRPLGKWLKASRVSNPAAPFKLMSGLSAYQSWWVWRARPQNASWKLEESLEMTVFGLVYSCTQL